MKRSLFVLVPLVVALLIAWSRWYGHGAHGRAELAYPPGTRVTYALDWSSTADTDVPQSFAGNSAASAGRRVGADLHVKGEFVVRRVEAQPGKTRLCASFARLEEHRADVFGQDLAADAAAADKTLLGHEGCFELDGRGRVERFLFAEASPVLFQQFVQGVVEAMQYTAPPDAAPSWDGEEASTLGTALSHYSAGPDAADAIAWTRDAYRTFTGLPPWARDAQPAVDGRGTIAFDADPGFKALSGRESVDVPDTAGNIVYAYRKNIELRRLRVEADSAGSVAGNLRAYPIGRPIGVEAAIEAAEVHAAEKASLADIRSAVFAYNGGQIPGAQMLSMVTFLRRNPSACADLGQLLRQAGLNLTQRGLLVDLLVAAATPDAQRALRDALSSPELAGNEEARTLGLQRFALVRTPTAESAAFLRAEIAAAAKRGAEASHHAALISLGSMAGRMGDSLEERAARAAAVQTISEALTKADSTSSRVAALVALGGTNDAAQVDTLTSYATDGDAHVRAGVAAALGFVDGRQSNAALFQLAGDSEGMVAQMALRPLAKRELDADQRRLLETLIVNNGTNARADTELATVVARQADADPEAVRRMLNALLARQDPGSELAMGLRRMLQALNAG